MTNVRDPEGIHAPMGQFAHMRTYPTASNHEVTAPNTDTLDTMVWLDVSKEPWVVSIPETHDRYCLFSLLDGWTTVFQSLGKRTTGTGPQKFAITGPGWKGKLPSGLKAIQVAYQHRVGARPHLLHRHDGGLRGRARYPGRLLRRSAQLVRETLHAAAGPGGSDHRYGDLRARAGQ